MGSGGVGIVADAVGVSPDTVRRGRAELDDPEPLPVGRSRGPGGGRKRAEEHDPDLPAALDKLVDPDSRGDPMTPLRWTSKSLRGLADQLRTQGHHVSATLVGRLLHEAGYSLQANSKTLEGAQHPDRDAQFRHIGDTVAAALAAGMPVVSVDCKEGSRRPVLEQRHALPTRRRPGEGRGRRLHRPSRQGDPLRGL